MFKSTEERGGEKLPRNPISEFRRCWDCSAADISIARLKHSFKLNLGWEVSALEWIAGICSGRIIQGREGKVGVFRLLYRGVRAEVPKKGLLGGERVVGGARIVLVSSFKFDLSLS